ncbi:DUF4231 domain-containing protein [Amycolatopsis sp. NPDC051102]|uniref:DUF4231 domain-containing protein n=1 Tax=Amycolatopsis sp. NPDC051102 TaxID=3155163 RepID=UPI00342C0149
MVTVDQGPASDERKTATVATPPRKDTTNQASYSLNLANDSYAWYRAAAIKARQRYKTFETAMLVTASAIPVSAALFPNNTIAPAILGAVVVVLTGLRSIFHFQDNFLRFSEAREAIEAERRLYLTSSSPYDNANTRDKELAAAVTKIERDEMAKWIGIAREKPRF